ncbi:MAG: ABC transporter ATP-binding protein [Lachnospiraceae bacterium]|nr:ABC transporter ATP-binding protein [Lachnospiraceae bacterium]
MFKLFSEYKWIYELVPKAKKIVLKLFILSLVLNLLQIALPLIFSYMIDSVFVKRNYTLFGVLIIAYSFVYVLSLLFALFIEKVNLYMTKCLTNELKSVFFRKALSLEAEKLSNVRTGDMVITINNNVEEVYRYFNTILLSSLLSYIYLAVLFVIMVAISWEVAIIIFVFSGLVICFSNIFKQKFAVLKKEYRRKFGDYSSWLVEILNGMQDIHSNNAEEYVQEVFGDYVQNLLISKEKARFVEIRAERLNALFTTLFTVIFWAISAVVVIIGKISLGNFLALEKYFNYTMSKIDFIRNAHIEYHNYRPGFEKLAELYQMQSEYLDGGKEIELKGKCIQLKNVYFQYKQDRPVLENVNMQVRPSSFVALVGANGEGKSTILGLLVQFYRTSSGDIYFDDIRVSDIAASSLRNQIGYMQQDTIIFEGTLAENLRLYAPNATEEEMWTALKSSGLLETIRNWEAGLETDLHKGARLSGGQKQRIAFARILLKDAPIILMDEPTSALDEETEKNLLLDIKKIFAQKLVIMVSHRCNAVKKADYIFVLNQGKVIASGTDQELKNSCDLYNQLFYHYEEGKS